MNMLVNLMLRLWYWLTSCLRREPKPLRTVRLEELPVAMAPGTVYVLGEGPHRWFVAMLCPCGCGETVQVSLLSDAKPRWWLTEHPDNTISLQPSIWRRAGCRSHFYLKQGIIQWCG